MTNCNYSEHTKIQRKEIQKQIEELQEKLQKLEEIEKQPRMNLQQEGEYAVVSYHDKVYYRLGGEFDFSWYIKKDVSDYHIHYRSPNLVMVEDAETDRLLEGLYYNHIQVKKEKEQRVKDAVRESVKWCEEHPDKDPLDWLKPQTPEQVEQGLKEAFREAVKQGIIPEVDKVRDVFMNEMVEKQSKTLTDIVYRWWEDVFTTHSDWDMETSIDDLIDQVEQFLPKQKFGSSQNVLGDVDIVEGFNDCLKKIKSKLR